MTCFLTTPEAMEIAKAAKVFGVPPSLLTPGIEPRTEHALRYDIYLAARIMEWEAESQSDTPEEPRHERSAPPPPPPQAYLPSAFASDPLEDRIF